MRRGRAGLVAGVLAAGALVAGALVGAAAEEPAAWRAARPDYAWAFPRDHWARPGYRTEWWYLTGHLAESGDPGRRLGYQLTLFRIGLTPRALPLASAWSASDLVMGHAAVTDLGAGRHVFSEVLYRAIPLLGGFGAFPDPRLAWSRAPAGTDGEWSIRWNGAAFDLAMADRARGIAFRLATRPRKPLVLQGPNGYSRKGAGPAAASQYYSFTRLDTRGVVTVGGREAAVAGESWMDKEFGSNRLGPGQAGWDWFSLQLADGRELMLYLLRDRRGAVDTAQGTAVGRDGHARGLGAGDFAVRATGRWTSRASGTVYPAGWEVAVPGEGLRLTVAPELADQENVSALVPGLHYWEGAVAVRDAGGEPAGRGYVELVGYGSAGRPGG